MKSTKELINSKYSLNKYTLEENFNQACTDNTFKKIVERLDVPKEMLIKYTSLFQDAAREIKNCTKLWNAQTVSVVMCIILLLNKGILIFLMCHVNTDKN